jgi:maltose alpha-D-glucosyltransferase/alpha-amylase
MLGSAALPPITGKPYFLTLGPHGFYWFNLLPKFTETAVPSNPDAELPVLSLSGRWETLFGEPTINAVEQSLLAFVNRRNLRRGATREAKAVKVADRMPLPVPGGRMLLVLLRVDLFNGDSEYQWVPLGFKTGADADALLRDRPHLAVARATRTAQGTPGVLYSDAEDQAFVRALVVSMSRRRNHKTEHGKLRAWGSADLWQQRRELAELEPVPCPPGLRHSDTVIGKRLFLKLYRRVEPGSHPEIELNRFLTELSFDGAPALLGTLEYDSAEGETWALGVLHSWLPQARTAWEFTLDTLGRYFDRIESLPREQSEPPQPAGDTLECAAVEPPLIVQERLGTYVEAARLLGESTARLHLALASAPEHPEFAPEPFTPNYQRSLFQSYRNVLKTALGLLRQQAEDLPEALRPLAREALAREAHALQICRAVVDTHLSGRRIRVHGDYCLTQLLHSGRAFVIIDFEGEPERPLSERRIKRTPLRDVASLLSSFRYAAHAACQRHQESRWSGGAGPARLGAWTGFWSHWAGAVFLRSYLHTIGPSPLLPQTMTELRVLLNADWLNRIMVELTHEANHRRGQMAVPLQELLEVLPAASNPTHCSPG